MSRKTIDVNSLVPNGTLRFLYRNPFGRIVLKALISRPISKIVGAFLSSRLSTPLIKGFFKNNNIDLTEYKAEKYKCYNDAFDRKILPQKRPVDMSSKAFISPCDSALSIYEINKSLKFNIKNGIYDVETLVGSRDIAKDFYGGYCLIFRLQVSDYHRYLCIDNAEIAYNNHIKGKLHTVQPIALEKYDFFKENSREITLFDTENFDRICVVEIGAMMIGKIVNYKNSGTVKKGEERGYFKFGGSTIAVLVKSGVLSPDDEILENTKSDKETIVKYGEKIGNQI